MAQTIEHSTSFHLARRIAKLIAPEFRVFATDALKPREVVLDLKKLTIEVGERTQPFEAAGAILFCAGQLKIMKSGKFKEHFGDFTDVRSLDETKLVSLLAKQAEKVDKLSLFWSIDVFVSNWNISRDRAASILESYAWSASDWEDYYQNDSVNLRN